MRENEVQIKCYSVGIVSCTCKRHFGEIRCFSWVIRINVSQTNIPGHIKSHWAHLLW